MDNPNCISTRDDLDLYSKKLLDDLKFYRGSEYAKSVLDGVIGNSSNRIQEVLNEEIHTSRKILDYFQLSPKEVIIESKCSFQSGKSDAFYSTFKPNHEDQKHSVDDVYGAFVPETYTEFAGRIQRGLTLEVIQPSMYWESPSFKGDFPSFMKRVEISRHFQPFGVLTPDPEFIASLETVAVGNITNVIQDHYGTSLSLATLKVWRHLNYPHDDPDYPEKNPYNQLSFKCKISLSDPKMDSETNLVPVGDFYLRLKPVTMENISRIHRRFDSERFLTVEFDYDIFSLKHSIPEKLRICNRVYEFLYAASTSSCYYYATQSLTNEFNVVNTSDIINWHIPLLENTSMSLSSLASRLRVGFTPIHAVVNVSLTNVENIKDVIGDDGRCLTNGCSTIGRKRMLEIREALGLPDHKLPSAVLAQFMGYRGIWYLDRNLDPEHICLRESQRNYEVSITGESMEMEILAYSRTTGPSRLNSQLILILQCLGVPKEEFLRMQNAVIGSFQDMIFSEDTFLTAAYVDSQLRNLQIVGYTRFMFQKILEMILAGFDQSNWYMKSLLVTVFQEHVSITRDRSKLQVLNSRNVFIIPDPTGKLRDGQCFLQLHGSDENGDPLKCMKGRRIAVSRNSVYLPSDFRMYECIEIPELQHLREVLVLPIQGSICQAFILSGGIYDCHNAFITWDLTFVNSIEVASYKEPSVQFENHFIRSRMHVQDFVNDTSCDRLLDTMFGIQVESSMILKLLADWHTELADEGKCFDLGVIELAHVCRKLANNDYTELRPTTSYINDLMEKYDLQFPKWYCEYASKVRRKKKPKKIVKDEITDLIESTANNIEFDRSYDEDLMMVYKSIPNDQRHKLQSRVRLVLEEYMKTCNNITYNENRTKFREIILRNLKSIEEAKELAIVCYKITHEESIRSNKPLDFCYLVLGDYIESVKAYCLNLRKGKSDQYCLTIPRHILHRITIDRRVLLD